MSFCTAINCMDGRTQLPVINYLKKHFGVEYVDMITEAGANRVIAGQEDISELDSILRRVDISVARHNSIGIAVAGHHDCAGNPVNEQKQNSDTLQASEYIQKTYPDLPVIALWVDADGKVHRLSDPQRT